MPGNSDHSKLWSPKVLVGVGFLMLLLTSLQGWGMVAIIAISDERSPQLLPELRRLHNLGLSGGFLAISFGLALCILPPDARRCKLICRILLPSLLVAPVAFCDGILAVVRGANPWGLQAFFYGLQALSALGITLSLALIVVSIFRHVRSA